MSSETSGVSKMAKTTAVLGKIAGEVQLSLKDQTPLPTAAEGDTSLSLQSS